MNQLSNLRWGDYLDKCGGPHTITWSLKVEGRGRIGEMVGHVTVEE